MRAVLIAVLLAGCSHSAVRVSNAQAVASVPGSVNATGAIAAAVLVGTMAVAASQDPGTTQSTPASSLFSPWASQPVPALAPEREVGEQDCTKPIDLTAGNLRCR